MIEPCERLFFALWPNDRVRYSLQHAFNTLHDPPADCRRVNSANLHMTLHFLGNIPVSKVDCFSHQASQLRSEGFTLNVTKIGYFKKPRVLWMGCDFIPPALVELQARLGLLIESCDFTQESRPYNPHVTMARKVRRPIKDQSVDVIPWEVDRFCLILSQSLSSGVRYSVKESYLLEGEKGSSNT